jgi:hypothetical protein
LLFCPELLSQGFAGGRKAACEIISNIRNGIGTQFPSAKIWISVFANATGLGPVLFHHNYIPALGVLDDFISGFNDIDDLVTFVNVGRGKELTDTKLNGI